MLQYPEAEFIIFLSIAYFQDIPGSFQYKVSRLTCVMCSSESLGALCSSESLGGLNQNRLMKWFSNTINMIFPQIYKNEKYHNRFWVPVCQLVSMQDTYFFCQSLIHMAKIHQWQIIMSDQILYESSFSGYYQSQTSNQELISTSLIIYITDYMFHKCPDFWIWN